MFEHQRLRRARPSIERLDYLQVLEPHPHAVAYRPTIRWGIFVPHVLSPLRTKIQVLIDRIPSLEDRACVGQNRHCR